VNFKNVKSVSFIRERDFNFTVKTTRSQKCGIQSIRSVGCHHTLDSAEVFETIKLIQKLHKGTLDFSISRRAFSETLSSDSIDFIHKDDTGLVIFGISEHFSDNTGTLSDVLVDDGGGNNFEELTVHLTGKSSSQKSLSSTRWSIKQNTLRRLDSYSFKQLRVCEREFNSLAQVANLTSKTTNISILNITGIFGRHTMDSRINFSRENAHNRVSCNVESTSNSRLKKVLVNFRSATNDIAGST